VWEEPDIAGKKYGKKCVVRDARLDWWPDRQLRKVCSISQDLSVASGNCEPGYEV